MMTLPSLDDKILEFILNDPVSCIIILLIGGSIGFWLKKQFFLSEKVTINSDKKRAEQKNAELEEKIKLLESSIKKKDDMIRQLDIKNYHAYSKKRKSANGKRSVGDETLYLIIRK